MLKHVLYWTTLLSAIGLAGIGAAAAAESGAPQPAVHTAALTPHATLPATPVRPSPASSARDMAEINRRLAAMQREINRLKMEVNRLRLKRPAQAGSGGQSTHSADEAYTLAAEARALAVRAEQKADQALSAAYSH